MKYYEITLTGFILVSFLCSVGRLGSPVRKNKTGELYVFRYELRMFESSSIKNYNNILIIADIFKWVDFVQMGGDHYHPLFWILNDAILGVLMLNT